MILLAETIIDPGWSGLALAALLMAVLVVLALACGVNLVRQGLLATARATAQLLAVGLLLNWVFSIQHWAGIVGLLAVMSLVAGRAGSARVEDALRGTGPALTAILMLVLALTLSYVCGLVIGVRGSDARYLIPLGGMILGSAMNSGSLAAQRFHDDLRQGRETVLAALGLGASPPQATRRAFRRAFQAGITPTLNAMFVVGIVKLPGMMSGQMLGGSSPFQAAKYQLVVMFMLAFGDGLTALATLLVIRRLAFTSAWQPRL